MGYLILIISVVVGLIGVYVWKRLTTITINQTLVEYFKQHRRFITLNKKTQSDVSQTIRVMQYNILANGERWALGPKHHYLDIKYRKWSYRFKRLIAEITAYNADIICLQEMDGTTEKQMINSMKHIGYDAYVGNRFLEGNKPKQVIGIFWKQNKFQLLNKAIFNFSDIMEHTQLQDKISIFGSKESDYFKCVKNRDDIAIITHLKSLQNDKEFIACCSHFYYHPNFPDVKLTQTLLFNIGLHNIITSRWKLNSNKIPIFFCVDANSLSIKRYTDTFDKVIPENGLISGAYTLMTRGIVNKHHTDHPFTRCCLRDDKQFKYVANISNFTNDKILWRSAYRIRDKDPIWTTKVDTFEGTIDYIWINKNCETISYLEMPYSNILYQTELNASNDMECAQKFSYLPNVHYPSDHLALACDLTLFKSN